MVFIILTRTGWDKLFSRLVKDCDAVWLNNGVLSDAEVFQLREAGWDLTVWTSRLTDLTSEIETVREHYPNQVILTEAAAAKIFAAFIAPSCMRSLIATLSLLALAGCSDEVTTRFGTLADAREQQAFQRGWLPLILPDSATSIVEQNNLDLNTGTGSFDYDLSERAAYIKRLTEAGAPSRADEKSDVLTLTKNGSRWEIQLPHHSGAGEWRVQQE